MEPTPLTWLYAAGAQAAAVVTLVYVVALLIGRVSGHGRGRMMRRRS